MKREFRWNGQRLADPDPSLTPEQVRDLYAQMPGMSALTTAAVEVVTEENGVQIQTFAEAKKPAATASSGGTQRVNFVPSQGKRG